MSILALAAVRLARRTIKPVLVGSPHIYEEAKQLPLRCFWSWGNSANGNAGTSEPPASSSATSSSGPSQDVTDALTNTVGDLAPASSPLIDLTVTGPISGMVYGMSTMQATTGLPWWMIITASAVGMRASMLPLMIQQVKTIAMVAPLWKKAMSEVAEEYAQRPLGDPKQRSGEQQEEQLVMDSGVYLKVYRRVLQLQDEFGAPNPLWVVASVAGHMAANIILIMSIRAVCIMSLPGLETGGTLWFQDLTATSLVFDPESTGFVDVGPMGSFGTILPILMARNANRIIQNGFSRVQASSAVDDTWAVAERRVGTVLGLVSIPFVLGAGMLLPHAVSLAIFTTTSLTLLANKLLSLPGIRQFMGLHAGVFRKRVKGGRKEKLVDVAPEVVDFAAAETDVASLTIKAAELRAAGHIVDAIFVMQRAVKLDAHFAGYFALGQMYGSIRQWELSAMSHLKATKMDADDDLKAKAWFGYAVAVKACNQVDQALEGFWRAEQLGVSEVVAHAQMASAAVHRERGNWGEAERALQRLRRVDPKAGDKFLKELQEERRLLKHSIP